MSTEVFMKSLQNRHAEIEFQLEKERNRPLPDQALIIDLKKQKLRIKDELEGHCVH